MHEHWFVFVVTLKDYHKMTLTLTSTLSGEKLLIGSLGYLSSL